MAEQDVKRHYSQKKWFPFAVGIVISPVFMLVMKLLWQEAESAAAVWTVSVALFGWPRFLWRTPGRKIASTALLLGTFVPVWLWLSFY